MFCNLTYNILYKHHSINPQRKQGTLHGDSVPEPKSIYLEGKKAHRK